MLIPIIFNEKGKQTVKCSKCSSTKRFEMTTGLRIHLLSCVGNSPTVSGFASRKLKLGSKLGATSGREASSNQEEESLPSVNPYHVDPGGIIDLVDIPPVDDDSSDQSAG